MMTNRKALFYILLAFCVCVFLLWWIPHEKKAAYQQGYDEGYKIGYSDGYADKGKLTDNSTIKTETKIVYEKIPYTGNDVQVTTEKPVVTVSVNGKQQKIEQKTETADLKVKTDTEVKIKIPERRWKFGIGTDGHKTAYMLSAPVKGAVGVWAAGNKDKFMGGLSVSF